MRDEAKIEAAVELYADLVRQAFKRNGHKKDPAQEGPRYWWDKALEEAYECHEAWLRDDEQRFLEELGDCGTWAVGLLLHGGYVEPEHREEGGK